MEVVKWNKNKGNEESGFMVRVSPEEALEIIQSLTTQIIEKSPNAGRTEFLTKKNEYFSIAVHEAENI